jgi:hypothetical protein
MVCAAVIQPGQGQCKPLKYELHQKLNFAMIWFR